MSGSSGLPGRYSKALYELAKEKKVISKIVKDFEDFKNLLQSNELLINMIKSPAISKSEKQLSIIAVLKKAKADKLTVQFCGVLANNGRLNILSEIMDVFLSHVSSINGEVQAEVTSSLILEKEQQVEVESAISKATGVKKIVLSMKVDKSLIGGLIVKIGSKMIDNSIKTKLNRLEIAMRGTN